MQTSNDLTILFRYINRRKTFLLFILAFFLLSYLINNCIFNYIPYKLDSSVKTLMLGDSQVSYALNPDIINNSINTAQADEPYAISYLKLKYFHKNNKHIENVVVNYSPLHFSHEFDKIFTHKMFANEMLRRSIFFIRKEDLKYFDVRLKDYIESFIRYRLIIDFRLFSNLIASKFNSNYFYLPFIRGFIESGDKKTYRVDVDKILKQKFPDNFNVSRVKDAQYLDSIAAFTSKNSINLYLIGMPMNRELYKKIPVRIKKYLEDKSNRLTYEFNNTKFIPCFTMLDDTLFHDAGHVNSSGEVFFSEYVNKIVN